jgi:hypothetical protein
MDIYDIVDQIEIQADHEKVFSLVSDLRTMGSWSPENTGGHWLDGVTVPTVGARFEGTNEKDGDTWSTIATVTAIDPPSRFAFHVTYEDDPISDWEYFFEPTNIGCIVTEQWRDRRPQSYRDADAEEGFDRHAFTIGSIRTTLERLRLTCEAR